MRAHLFIIPLLLVYSQVLVGQIKIGDNPQNIDPSSVLELESTSRVLVITRVTTSEMDAITPRKGALVYNTDEDCIFYYEGTAWLNLCAPAGLSLTADALVNPFPTIVLTENGDQTNVEVGEIRGINIVDFSISAADIQNNSITADKLSPNSVGVEELQDNTVADNEIDYNLVTLSDFINDSGYITAANIVSGDAGNDVSFGTDSGAYFNAEALENAIQANTDAISADGDTDASNEIQNLNINGNTLEITGGNTVDLGPLNNSGTDDQNLSLSGNTLSIEDGNAVDLSAFNNPGTDNQNLTGAALSGNTLTINIENGNPASVDLSALSGTGTDDQLLDLAGNVISIEDGNSIDLTPILGGGGTDDQTLDLTGNVITIEDGNSIDLTPILGSGGTDDQQLSLAANTLSLEDGGTVDLAPYLDNTDEQDLTGASLSPGNILTIDIENGASTTVDLSSLAGAGTDDQEAFEVPFTPTGNTLSDDVQEAIEELQTEIDGISAGAGNPTDELITSFTLNNTSLEIVENANVIPPLDLDPVFATDAELAAINVDDADADPANEIQTITSPDTSVTVTQVGNDYELSVTDANSDDQNIQGSVLTGETLTIGIEDGTAEDVDLSPFATDGDLAASDAADLDKDDTNELQIISSPDASINVTQVGNDYELTVAGGSTDDQNIQGSGLTAETLTIGIEGGNPEDVDLSSFATEIELAAAIAASEALDGDMNDANELQTISSPDASVNVTQVGNDYELTVAGGSTDDQNIQGSGLTAETLTIGIEGGNPEDVDLSSFATEIELATAIAASEALDGDMSDTNEIQNISSPDASVNVTQIGNDYELTVAGGAGSVLSDGITITGDGTTGNELQVAAGGIVGGLGGTIADNSITASDLAPDSVDSSELRIDSVGESELKDQAVTPTKVQPGTVGDVLTTTASGVAWQAPGNPFHAYGSFNGFSGSILNSFGASVAKNGVGSYTVNFTNAANGSDYVIQLSLQSGASGTTIRASSPVSNLSFNVMIEDSAQTPADAIWYFTILDF